MKDSAGCYSRVPRRNFAGKGGCRRLYFILKKLAKNLHTQNFYICNSNFAPSKQAINLVNTVLRS